MRTLLLDSDVIAYQFASTAEDRFDWGDGVESVSADLKSAIKRADSYIENLKDRLEATEHIVALSDRSGRYFRHDILPSYKGNRKGVRKPSLLGELKDHLTENHPSYVRPGLEADDILGILSTHPKLIKGRKVIVSADKDMRTIPGLFFDTSHPDKGVENISEEDADYRFYLQTLTGDTCDGYKGCPNVGPVRADSILSAASTATDDGDFESRQAAAWFHIVEAFVSRGLTEEDALQQARVARILRASDYDFNNKEVIPWQPCS